MNGPVKRGGRWWLRETLLVLAALLAGLLFVVRSDAADEPSSRRIERQVDVMERIVDQVLIDSPNFLVSGRDNARGLYIDEFGVVITFDATLVREGGDDYSKMFKKWEKGFRIERNEKGDIVFVLPDGKGEDREPADSTEAVPDELRTWRDREFAREERLYKRGKTELIDVLLDYGDTLTSLPKGKWVSIVAFLRDSAYFDDRELSKLGLKTKIDDLRAYAAGTITEEEMIKRIIETEW